jgi:predicted ATPase
MIIQSVHVKNFRSVLDEVLSCSKLTAIVGPNGAGKSSFLRAIELFYDASAKVEVGDFYNEDTGEEIVIGVTFADLSAVAKKRFDAYLQGDTLTVERVIRCDDGRVSSSYHGASLQHAGFRGIREGLAIKDRGKTAKVVTAFNSNVSFGRATAEFRGSRRTLIVVGLDTPGTAPVQ